MHYFMMSVFAVLSFIQEYMYTLFIQRENLVVLSTSDIAYVEHAVLINVLSDKVLF